MDRSVLAVLGTVLLACVGLPAQVGQQGQEVFSEDWRWVEFGPESGIPSNRVFDLIETSESVPWVATDRGLAWYDGTIWHPVPVDGWTGTWSSCDLEPDLSGGVLASDSKSLYRGDTGGLRKVDLQTRIQRAVPLSEDELLIAAQDGLFRFDGTNLRAFPEPGGERIYEAVTPIFRTREGFLWSRTMNGTYLWKDGQWLRLFDRWVGFVSLSETEGVLGGYGTPIAGLWTWSGPVGTAPRRITGDGVAALRSMDAITGGFGIASYISGRVRVRMEGEQWTELQKVPLQIANARFLKIQSNGDLWAGGDEGLHLFRYVPRWHRLRFEGPEGANQINDLLMTGAGDLWVATSAGVYIKRADGEVERVQSILGQPLQTITGLCEDAEGGIWVSSGLEFSGAYRLH
ncbi:MAG: ligand-binding sensor domain-containing protein, partial [Planctomycetota bacterium]